MLGAAGIVDSLGLLGLLVDLKMLGDPAVAKQALQQRDGIAATGDRSLALPTLRAWRFDTTLDYQS